jgi:hypothetical protein
MIFSLFWFSLPVHLRLSAKSASQPSVFFTHKKTSQQYFQSARSAQTNRLFLFFKVSTSKEIVSIPVAEIHRHL